MKNKILMGLILLLPGVYFADAQAAQVGQIVVDSANVYQYPQAGSKVISTVTRGTTVPVSNFPTEGFYKARIANGEMGWISGNDILAGSAAPKTSTPNTRERKKPPQRWVSPEGDEEEDSNPSSGSNDHVRVLVEYGISNLSFAGLGANYEKIDGLNPGSTVGLELQFKMSDALSWAIRGEGIFGKTGSQVISNGSTQTITASDFPFQLGLVLSLFHSPRVRFSLGAYLGAAKASVAVNQVSSTTTGDVAYNSFDLCATGNAQLAYGLGKHFALVAEGAYHYEQSGAVPATTTFGAIPSFKINYTGILARLGIEMRF